MLFRLSDIWKSYGGTEILKGVSFQVNPSEKVGLVGRNGAGKTTVFRIITGQESADEGDLIKMNGLKLGLLDQHVDFGEAETVHTAALSAFKEIHDIEAEMRSLEKTMETDHSEAVLHNTPICKSHSNRRTVFLTLQKQRPCCLEWDFRRKHGRTMLELFQAVRRIGLGW